VTNMYIRKVTLNVKRKPEDEDEAVPEEEERESGSEWEEKEVDKPRGQRKRRKRRRVVSAANVHSDREGDIPEEDGWPTEPARRPCTTCLAGGWSCRVFGIQERGRQRYACQLCKHLKKGCSIMPSRRKEVTKLMMGKRGAEWSRQRRAGEEEEDDDEGEEEVADRRKRQRLRSPTRSKTRTTKVKMAGGAGGHPERSQHRSQQRSQQRRSEQQPPQSEQPGVNGFVGSQAPNKKGKGKGKGKAEREYEDDEEMESDSTFLPVKMEGEDGMEFQTSEYLL
jgi:hypothetical protein